MKKVTIVDDHPLIRKGIKNTLSESVEFGVIAEAADGNELMTELKNDTPDIVILDINMPGRSGVDLLKDLKKQYPQVPVLILSMHPEKRMALRSFKAGARGYLNKSSISDELVKAIRKITFQKRRYINAETARQLAISIDGNKNGQLHDALSNREFQIMRLISQDKSVDDIARQLSLSPQTVYTYRDRIKEKMNLNSNVAITRYVIENDLLE